MRSLLDAASRYKFSLKTFYLCVCVFFFFVFRCCAYVNIYWQYWRYFRVFFWRNKGYISTFLGTIWLKNVLSTLVCWVLMVPVCICLNVPSLYAKLFSQYWCRLLNPDLECSGSLFAGKYILQLILHLPSEMAPHVQDLVAALVRRMQSAEISGFRSSLLLIFARLVFFTLHLDSFSIIMVPLFLQDDVQAPCHAL